jgi:pSer/pThr/pTyr-binding forkhead associated (FHA) protein
MLIFTAGPAKDRAFPLADHKLVMIGRDASCTLQIVDPELSRCHLQIAADGDGKHSAIDFDSRNGVVVNGTKIEEKTKLSDGNQIVIGTSTIVYTTDDSVDLTSAGARAKYFGQGHLHTTSPD